MADILVVDDEENLSYSLQLALKRQGHNCRVAESVKAAITECASQLPDLILLDMQLPDGNGMDIMAGMREGGQDVPVIVITAFGTVASAVAFLASDDAAHINGIALRVDGATLS